MSFAFCEAAVLVYRMVEEVHVEIAIEVIVQEGCLGAEAGKVETVFLCFVCVYWFTIFYALANKELVAAVKGFILSHPTHVDIQEAIIVNPGV
jgi:hypothetical protein